MGWLERVKKASAAQWEIAEGGTNFSADFDLVYRRVATLGMPAPDDAL